ncbi:hypothetical protein D9M68_486910 [compost metagenome]
MSVCTRAAKPASTRVTPPTMPTSSSTSGASRNRPWLRAIRYTPAVTMVAAWISAETGVGPAIASASQVCSGSWADLPTAPPSSIRVAMLIQKSPLAKCCGARTSSSWMFSVPRWANRMNRPMAMNTSPTRVTMKAFSAALPFGVWLK